jgi:exosortase
MYGLWVAASAALFWQPVLDVFRLALQDREASYIPLIPLFAATVILVERKAIFQQTSSDWAVGIVFLIPAGLIPVWLRLGSTHWTQSERLSAYILALVLFWIAGFGLLFGRCALRTGRFVFLFLFLTVPMPDFLSHRVVYFLERGTTEIVAVLFDLARVPNLREGFVFHLAKVSIAVAPECSGIRSSMALIILALLIAHFSLRSFWRQSIFVIFGLFVMILKNAIRIVTLTTLAIYVSPQFLYGRLHHEGGVVFFVLGLLLLIPCLWILQYGEMRESRIALPSEAGMDRAQNP